MKREKSQRLCDVHLGLWLVKEFQQKQWQCYLQWHQIQGKWQVTKACCCSRVSDKISLHWQGAISGLNIQMKPAVLGFEYSAQHKPTNWHPCRRDCLHFSSLSHSDIRASDYVWHSKSSEYELCNCFWFYMEKTWIILKRVSETFE